MANDISRLIVEITVDVPGNGKDLAVAVHHWQSGTDNSDEFRRAVDSLRVAQAVADLNSVSNVYVVMGDMNEEIDNVPQSPNPFAALPTGLPTEFHLGAALVVLLTGPGIENNPFVYLQRSSGPGLTSLPAVQFDGSDATRPSAGRRLPRSWVRRAR